MKNLLRKSTSLLLVLVLVLASFSACTPKEDPKKEEPKQEAKKEGSQEKKVDENKEDTEQIVIKFLHKWPQEERKVYFDEVIAAFEAEHPNVKIESEAAGDEPIKDKLRILMGSDDQPDIFFSWSGEFAKKFIRSGNALDLTEFIDADPAYKDSIMEAGFEPYSQDGKIYGVPFRIDGKFFVYNKKMFADNGLEAPKTWDEFLNVCETLKSNGITPISLGNIHPWAGCHWITGLNQKMVPDDVRATDYLAESGEYTDAGYVKALDMFKELNDKGYFNMGVNSTEHNMSNEMFYAGQSAMTYIEIVEFSEVKEKMGDDGWGFFVMPATDGPGTQSFIVGAPDGFMVSAKTKQPELAVEFLKFLTNAENSAKMVEMLGWPSTTKGAVNDSNSDPMLVAGMEAITDATGMALWLDTDINIKISDVYLPGIQELFNDDITSEELMKRVQEVAAQVKEEAK